MTKDDSNSANFSWQKNGQKTVLRIYGTLGTTYALLTSEPGKAQIEMSDDEIYYGTNPQELLWQTTGWIIPVEELQHWIMGLHQNAPDYQLNAQGFVSHINYTPWLIDFQQYKLFQGLDMPQKLKVKHPEITLKFSIHDWDFSPN